MGLHFWKLDTVTPKNNTMIQSKKDLEFYIAADRIMNGLPAQRTIKEVLFNRRGG